MIVSLHVATGAALGALTRSRLAALTLGPPLHLACDRVPHEDINDRRFEIRSGLFGMALLALSRGPLDPATLGAASASAPDLEHIFPRLRPSGRKLFHGRRGWHRAGSFRADVQLVLAGLIIGSLLKPQRWGLRSSSASPRHAPRSAEIEVQLGAQQPRRSADDVYSWARPSENGYASYLATPGPGDSEGGDIY